MKIAVVGPGAIGSAFAYRLARAGHDVTVVGRGERLAELERDGAIVLVEGERADVTATAKLDETAAWDLVLVTVHATQVDAVLPALGASHAKAVMFMFNTFEPLDRLRDAVGAARFAFGFPAIVATLREGKLEHTIATRGQITTVGDAAWAKVFTDAGILTVVHGDMHSWLRSHAAFIVPVMGAAAFVAARGGAGISWSEARACARAGAEGYRLVRELGNAITPRPVAVLSRAPAPLLTVVLWALSRSGMMRDLASHGNGELLALLDMMTAAALGKTPALEAIRPRRR